MLGLNIGGGDEKEFFSINGWDTLDHVESIYNHNPDSIKWDIDLEQITEWPIKDNYYDMIYSSHTFEHLTDGAVNHTLSEAKRIMKEGAVIRITVPDVEIIWQGCKDRNKEVIRNAYGIMFIDNDLPYLFERAAVRTFYSDILDKWTTRPDDCIAWNHSKWKKVGIDIDSMTMMQFITKYKKIYSKKKYGSPKGHRNWFTAERLIILMEDIGFKDIKQSSESQSRSIEMRDENFDQTWPKTSLFIEGIKG